MTPASSPPGAAAAPPTRLADCTVLAPLGPSMLTTQFAARKQYSNGARLVTVHVLRPEARDRPRLAGVLVEEGTALRGVKHTNLVEVLDVVERGADSALVTELVDGRSLLELASALHRLGSFMPFTVTAYAVMMALDALDHVHRLKDPAGAPRVHLGLSPEAVVVGFDGRVKVGEFGLARAALAEPDLRATAFRARLGYVAPEVFAGGPVDRRADVFSAGVLLYELLTLAMPFGGATADLVIRAVRTQVVPPPSDINEAVPAALDEVCLRALEKDPARRFGNAAEMAVAVERALRGVPRETQATRLAALMAMLFPRDSDPGRLKMARLAGQLAEGAPRALFDELDDVPFEVVEDGDVQPVDPPMRPTVVLSEAETQRRERPTPSGKQAGTPRPAPAPAPPPADLGFSDATIMDLPTLGSAGAPALQKVPLAPRRSAGSSARAASTHTPTPARAPLRPSSGLTPRPAAPPAPLPPLEGFDEATVQDISLLVNEGRQAFAARIRTAERPDLTRSRATMPTRREVSGAGPRPRPNR